MKFIYDDYLIEQYAFQYNNIDYMHPFPAFTATCVTIWMKFQNIETFLREEMERKEEKEAMSEPEFADHCDLLMTGLEKKFSSEEENAVIL